MSYFVTLIEYAYPVATHNAQIRGLRDPQSS